MAVAGLLFMGISTHAQSDRVVITPAAGYSILWDGNNGGFSSPEPGTGPGENAALTSKGTVAFGSSEVGLNTHFIANVNDGFYGNSASWIPNFIEPADANPFIGLAFSASTPVSNIAWGRDNGDASEPACGGTCMDRAVGIYTLQITTVANPGVDTPEAATPAEGWVTIGTVEYKPGSETTTFSSYLRHRFDVSKDSQPIPATGIRIKVSANTMAIDEIEVNAGPDLTPPISNFITINNSTGYNVSWDGNNGAFFSESSPAPAPQNRALASNGSTAFASSEFGAGVHFADNVIDGLYGNSHSWIPKFTDPIDPNPFVGVKFPSIVQINNVAWGRDNGDNSDCCGGQLTDRALGTYILQITRVDNPDANTAETGDPTTGWATVATLNYKSDGQPFTSYLRHRFEVATSTGEAVAAKGLRIKVSAPTMAIDEIEVNVNVAVEQNLVLIAPETGYEITWDGNDGEFYKPDAGARAPENLALAATGTTAFGSSELGFGIHFVRKVNDGFYGNSSSWISANGLGGSDDPDPYVGVAFGKSVAIQSIAWGRDNGDTTEGGCGGTCLDRSIGIYTLQVTTVSSPGTATTETGDAATGWATIGTVEYVDDAPPGFIPSRRHRFGVSKGGQPINATGLRIKVSTGSIAIDEIEVNPTDQVTLPPITDLLVVNSAPGFAIGWDGNDGEFQSPAAIAPPPSNLALASAGTTAFGSSEFGAGVHLITAVNDGRYGNANSWIANFNAPGDPNPFIGLNFGKTIGLRSIAFGRDNGNTETDCCGGTLTDRALGLYTIQITGVANPGANTPETGDASTGWITIGTLEYKAGFTALFNPHLRHRYSVSANNGPIPATGVRIKVSANTMAIDEIEVNPAPTADENTLFITPETGFAISWDGNNGDYSTPDSPARAPENEALSSRGTVAFGSSEFGGGGAHLIANVNDGLYGNAHSWISNFPTPDTEPFIGLKFGRSVAVRSIAWGRDNGDVAGDCCGGTLTDRAGGNYVVQYTTLENPGIDTAETGDPSTGWATIGTWSYRGAGSAIFRQHLRHSYDITKDGQPITATGLRIKVPNVNTAIDEIEVNTQIPPLQQKLSLTIAKDDTGLVISWTGTAVLESTTQLPGGWTEVAGATSPHRVTTSGAAQTYFRLRR